MDVLAPKKAELDSNVTTHSKSWSVKLLKWRKRSGWCRYRRHKS
ncbi:hypothetical protein O9929_24035 [Vibrio lentus]|nr:hypothetical protein [Vibrio lentus]